MKTLIVTLAAFGTLLVYTGDTTDTQRASTTADRAYTTSAQPLDTWSAATDDEVIQEYCVRCHSDRRLRGNMSLERFEADNPQADGELTEKMIVKLRAGMMPPPGVSRPAGDTLLVLVENLESRIDAAARSNPNPGGRTFQRLNQIEYERSIHDLLGLEIDASSLLPLDTKSANFDNIADVQLLSPTLLDAYLNAAAVVSRLAIGDPNAAPSSATFTNPGYATQWDRVEGSPLRNARRYFRRAQLRRRRPVRVPDGLRAHDHGRLLRWRDGG